MAATLSSFIRSNASKQSTSVQPGALVAPVVPSRKFLSRPPAPRTGTLFSLPKEPEDARLTGGTRSLDRRLLALNVAGTLPKLGVAKVTALPARPAVA